MDTSFAVEALIGSQPLHDECVEYLAQLAESGCLLVFNHLLLLELEEAAFRLALKERHGKDWHRRRHDGRALRRAARLVEEVTAAWDAVLESFEWSEYSIEEVHSAIPRLMGRYGLASYDAIHAATATVSTAGCIVTIDTGFAYVPESELHLYVDTSRVCSCRERRSPTRRST